MSPTAGATRYAVLLRGINLGGQKLPMAQFRELLTGLGHTGVKTILASGQAVLTSDRSAADIAAELGPVLEREANLTTQVILRTGAQLAEIVAECPYPGAAEAGNRHAVVFLGHQPTEQDLLPLAQADWGEDTFQVRGSEIYLHLPDGFADSKLSIAVGKIKGVPATTRNWNTVLKLAALTAP